MLKKKKIKCKRISDVNYAKEISAILKSNLLTPSNYEILSEDQKNSYKNTGFVIGDQNLKTLEKWISKEENIIILAFMDIEEKEKTVGYLLTLQTKDIQDQVKKYLEDMINLDENLAINLEEDFSYLIQVAVNPDYINNRIGSTMFNELKRHIERTVVSYVMKNPLLNEISLYTHIKVGFLYFGDYIGKYNNFKNYQSIGLILPKSSIKSKTTLKKDIILNKMKEASRIVLK